MIKLLDASVPTATVFRSNVLNLYRRVAVLRAVELGIFHEVVGVPSLYTRRVRHPIYNELPVVERSIVTARIH